MKRLTLVLLMTLLSLSSYASSDVSTDDVYAYIQSQFKTPRLKFNGTVDSPCDVSACGYEYVLYNNFKKLAELHCEHMSDSLTKMKYKITKNDIRGIKVDGPDKIVAYDVNLEAVCVIE